MHCCPDSLLCPGLGKPDLGGTPHLGVKGRSRAHSFPFHPGSSLEKLPAKECWELAAQGKLVWGPLSRLTAGRAQI